MTWTGNENPATVLTVPISPDGRINLYSHVTTSFTIRVLGWYADPLVNPVTYTYDANGNRATETNPATGQTTTYSWDPFDRLTTVQQGTNTGPAQTIINEPPNLTNWHAWWGTAAVAVAGGVTFNPTGERNAFTGLSMPPGSYELTLTGPDNAAVNVSPYLTGHQNWVQQVEPVEKVGSQGQLAARNWTGTKKWAFTIPAAPNGQPSTHLDMRLVANASFTVTNVLLQRVPSPATTNVYDADGQRLIRKDPNGKITAFLGGQEIVFQTGSTTVIEATRYYNGSTTLATRNSNGQLNYLATDHQGTVIATLTPTFATTRQRYKPFGAQRGTSNTLPSEIGFLGQVEDTATGLSYLNARHYDPTNGLFISTDPLLLPYDPSADTRYGYSRSNPINTSDPQGTEPGSWCNTSQCTRDRDRGRRHNPQPPTPAPLRFPPPRLSDQLNQPSPTTSTPSPPPPSPAQLLRQSVLIKDNNGNDRSYTTQIVTRPGGGSFVILQPQGRTSYAAKDPIDQLLAAQAVAIPGGAIGKPDDSITKAIAVAILLAMIAATCASMGICALSSDDDDDSDPHGVEELTGHDPDSLAGLINAHTPEDRFAGNRELAEEIAEVLKDPWAEVKDLWNGIAVRDKKRGRTIIINADLPGKSTVIKEKQTRWDKR
jgi:RHS repeat-associated protein